MLNGPAAGLVRLGRHRVAVLDPNATQTDAISGRPMMKEVLSILGPALESGTFTQPIQLTSGIAESYTPTAIGADRAVCPVDNAVLFSIAR